MMGDRHNRHGRSDGEQRRQQLRGDGDVDVHRVGFGDLVDAPDGDGESSDKTTVSHTVTSTAQHRRRDVEDDDVGVTCRSRR